MNVLDSSAWLEYLNDGSAADAFEAVIQDPWTLLVPSICITEVRRQALRFLDPGRAARSVSAMLRGSVVDLDARLAALAADIGLEHHLALADSIIYATAQSRGATLWTMDDVFECLPGVEYVKRAE